MQYKDRGGLLQKNFQWYWFQYLKSAAQWVLMKLV